MAAADAVREVTGTDLPFEEAVTQGLVPPPPLMDWNQFQRWRRTDGQRPNRETDGFLRTSRQEAELWKRIMPIYHGEDWLVDLQIAVAAGESAGSAGEEHAVPPIAAPEPVRAGAPIDEEPRTGAREGPASPVTPRREEPGSGGSGPGAQSPGPRGVEYTPPSPAPSSVWSEGRPGSPGKLQRRIMANYRPEKEDVDTYAQRVMWTDSEA